MTPERAVEWMAEHGHPGYRDRIHSLRCTISEVIGEAGRYWQHCEFTQETIRKIEQEIEEEKHDALERYTDWATD